MMWHVQSINWGPRRSRRARAAVLFVATVIVVSQWARVFDDFAQDDFRLHWTFGQRFLAGQFLYAIGHTPYPPFWGMICSPLSLLPKRWAHVVAYPLGPCALAALVIILNRLTRRSLPLAREPLFWATALALALSSRFVIRELPECGPNLLMVTLAWLALALWRSGRDAIAGALLGLAIAMKCTQALFVPYFILKRQWRMVAATTAFTLLFSAAPVLWQGPALYERHVVQWAGNCWKGLRSADPSVGMLGQEEVWNVALRPTLARYLMHLPAGHKGRITSAWRAEALDLPPHVAGAAIKGVMFLVLASVAWKFRRPAVDRDDDRILWEAAVVSLLILLYSPLTWRQHCVAVVPAFYLIVRTAIAKQGLAKWMRICIFVYVFLVLLLDRGIVGREMTFILDSFGATTLSLVLLLAVTIGLHGRESTARIKLDALRQSRPRFPGGRIRVQRREKMRLRQRPR